MLIMYAFLALLLYFAFLLLAAFTLCTLQGKWYFKVNVWFSFNRLHCFQQLSIWGYSSLIVLSAVILHTLYF